jgi:type IV pilus assembly protein PilM
VKAGRIFLGLDIGQDRLRAVALRRAMKKNSLLVGTRSIPLEKGVLHTDLRTPNILRPELFVQAVGELLTPIGGKEERVAVTLGAGAGLIMPVEMESGAKNRQEGEELLRWQLKNRIPVDPAEINVAYQVLEKTDSGRSRVLAGIMDREVLEQYETLLNESGFNPVKIEFHILSLFNFYRSRFDFGNDFILIAIESGEVGMMYFQGGTLRFCRTRQRTSGTGRLVQELHRSAVTCHDQFPGSGRAAVFLHGSDPRIQSLSPTVSEVFGRETVVLNPHQDLAQEVDLEHCHHLVAAIGAAEGMM